MGDDWLVEILRGTNLGNMLIAISLVYLGLEVRGLRKVIDRLVPKVDEHGDRIAGLESWREAIKDGRHH